MGCIVAVDAVADLFVFGGSGNNHTVSNSLNTEPGTTAVAATPASPRDQH